MKKYRLLKDLHCVEEIDATLVTRERLLELLPVVHRAGDIYELVEPTNDLRGASGTIPNRVASEVGLLEPYVGRDEPVGDARYAVRAPDGAAIVGTLERLSGVAILTSASVCEDGTLELAYEGTTDVWWNDQTTVHEAGERVFVDEHDRPWRESQLLLEPLAVRGAAADRPAASGDNVVFDWDGPCQGTVIFETANSITVQTDREGPYYGDGTFSGPRDEFRVGWLARDAAGHYTISAVPPPGAEAPTANGGEGGGK